LCTYNEITTHNLGLLTVEMNQHDDRDAEDDSEENVSSLGEDLSGVG
jgi:hypothetical protein